MTTPPADAMEVAQQKQWLFDRLVDEKPLMAEVGSPTNLIFEQLQETGLVKCYDSMFGNRYYSLTAKGRDELSPANAEKRAAEARREALKEADVMLVKAGQQALASQFDRGRQHKAAVLFYWAEKIRGLAEQKETP